MCGLAVDHGQQSLGHLRIVAQGSDPHPWYAEAAARQARHELLMDQPPGVKTLKKLRVHRGITQAEFSYRTRMPLEMLRQIEDGELSLSGDDETL